MYASIIQQILLSRVLTLSGEEVEEVEMAGFGADEQTYYCGNVCGKQVVQVRHLTVFIF